MEKSIYINLELPAIATVHSGLVHVHFQSMMHPVDTDGDEQEIIFDSDEEEDDAANCDVAVSSHIVRSQDDITRTVAATVTTPTSLPLPPPQQFEHFQPLEGNTIEAITAATRLESFLSSSSSLSSSNSDIETKTKTHSSVQNVSTAIHTLSIAAAGGNHADAAVTIPDRAHSLVSCDDHSMNNNTSIDFQTVWSSSSRHLTAATNNVTNFDPYAIPHWRTGTVSLLDVAMTPTGDGPDNDEDDNDNDDNDGAILSNHHHSITRTIRREDGPPVVIIPFMIRFRHRVVYC
jgi:hypothetical protein